MITVTRQTVLNAIFELTGTPITNTYTDDTRLDEFNLDSLDMFELCFIIEDLTGRSIEDTTIETWVTLGDVVKSANQRP